MNKTSSQSPESIDLILDSTEFRFFLYGGQPEYEKFSRTKNLKEKYDIFKFRPETYGYEPNQHLEEEGKVLVELIKLHKSKEIDIKEHLDYLKDITPYARTIETHFNLFKNLALAFASSKNAKLLDNLINQFNIVGSVLFEEFDFTRNVVEENNEVLKHTLTKTNFLIDSCYFPFRNWKASD